VTGISRGPTFCGALCSVTRPFQCVPIVRGNASWILDPRLYAEEPRVARAVVIHTHTGGNYGSRRTSLAAGRSNPDHHSPLSLLALSEFLMSSRRQKAAQNGRPFSDASLYIQRTFFLNLVSGVRRSFRVKCLPTGLSV